MLRILPFQGNWGKDSKPPRRKDEGGRIKDGSKSAGFSDSSFILHPSAFPGPNSFLILKVYPAFAPMLQEEPRQRPEGVIAGTGKGRLKTSEVSKTSEACHH